jgi:hypothetical protein
LFPSLSVVDLIKYSASFGGKEGVVNSFETRGSESLFAGRILKAVYAMDSVNICDSSIKKAKFLISNRYGISVSSLTKIWSKYCNVAHLLAARMDIDFFMNRPEMIRIKQKNNKEEYWFASTMEELMFLRSSFFYYNFATHRVEKRSKTSLIDGSSAWFFDTSLVNDPSSLLSSKIYSTTKDLMLDCYRLYIREPEITLDEEDRRIIRLYRA